VRDSLVFSVLVSELGVGEYIVLFVSLFFMLTAFCGEQPENLTAKRRFADDIFRLNLSCDAKYIQSQRGEVKLIHPSGNICDSPGDLQMNTFNGIRGPFPGISGIYDVRLRAKATEKR